MDGRARANPKASARPQWIGSAGASSQPATPGLVRARANLPAIKRNRRYALLLDPPPVAQISGQNTHKVFMSCVLTVLWLC